MGKTISLSRADKLLAVMYEMSQESRNLKFEDIVVNAFRKFPEDFHLRGYDEYPDSGDLVHKPLYDFRKKGYLEANNKVFAFTDRGLNYVKQVSEAMSGKSVKSTTRLSRFANKEIERIKSSEGFRLYLSGDIGKINDTDFYAYLGITARTSKNDFLGRLSTVNAAVEELSNAKDKEKDERQLIAYHNFLIANKFKSIVEYFNK